MPCEVESHSYKCKLRTSLRYARTSLHLYFFLFFPVLSHPRLRLALTFRGLSLFTTVGNSLGVRCRPF
ncbi:hypothetical protein BABINDRAFT_134970 [Babjeviella inositovora NRRL Y-12698]|uniref:Uncharacterized protein n=1 Tax=Babjeviella inositovora NRRL Y-12698 TaxID=984486 RepID=A0A1E3QPX7_9ASCO|nr:uncharacterized protein BABINDRAFT_134970 [Babjeviella inositovora NRRL Y-12698]ODQ79735.1 hypothetical protein BABINDRAFT_134970 [Babjeviella inositovora NRRL Y-12698]